MKNVPFQKSQGLLFRDIALTFYRAHLLIGSGVLHEYQAWEMSKVCVPLPEGPLEVYGGGGGACFGWRAKGSEIGRALQAKSLLVSLLALPPFQNLTW